jgi:hypothetical protein
MENEQFQSGNRGLLCSFRNQVSCIRRIVSKLALVLLLNTNARFRVVIEVCSAAIGTRFLVFEESYQNLH